MNKHERISEPSNGGRKAIESGLPYNVSVTIEGVADLLFHAWNAESIDEKAAARKNSAAKKNDDVESYVRRHDNGEIAIPGEYLRGSIINAAKFKQDPRSPRKSAVDLYKAGVVVTTLLAPLGVKTWDYLDKRRVTIQKAGINRTRPAMKAGWRAQFEIMVVLPEYIDQHALHEIIEMAGRLVGLADMRPTFGRYSVVNFEEIALS